MRASNGLPTTAPHAWKEALQTGLALAFTNHPSPVRGSRLKTQLNLLFPLINKWELRRKGGSSILVGKAQAESSSWTKSH